MECGAGALRQEGERQHEARTWRCHGMFRQATQLLGLRADLAKRVGAQLMHCIENAMLLGRMTLRASPLPSHFHRPAAWARARMSASCSAESSAGGSKQTRKPLGGGSKASGRG